MAEAAFIPLPGQWYPMYSCPLTEKGGGPVLIRSVPESRMMIAEAVDSNGTYHHAGFDWWHADNPPQEWSPIYTDLDEPVTLEWCESNNCKTHKSLSGDTVHTSGIVEIQIDQGVAYMRHPRSLGWIKATRGQVLAAIALEGGT